MLLWETGLHAHAVDQLLHVYTQYKALKGNGDMRDLRKTFRHLPMIPGGMPTEVSDDD